MPEPEIVGNEIRIRVKDPNLFVQESFRTIQIDKQKGIRAIIGKLKSNPQGGTVVQSFRFDKNKWTVAQAQEWVNEHGKAAEIMFLGNNYEIDFSDDGGIKEMNPIKKQYAVEIKGFDDEKLSFDAIASTSEIDRDGDILEASGWKLKTYRKNPVMLWSHEARMLPVGRAENVRIEDDKLKFTPIFTPKDINPMGEQIYKMFKSGFLNAFSIRFDPIDWEDVLADDNDRVTTQTGTKKLPGRHYKKQDLLEISPVTVPANAGALIERDYQDFAGKSILINQAIDVIEEPNARMDYIKGLFKEVIKDEIPEPIIKDEKSGRVLSQKNRTLVKQAIDALQAVYEASEPVQDEREIDDLINRLKNQITKPDLTKDEIQDLIDKGNELLK